MIPFFKSGQFQSLLVYIMLGLGFSLLYYFKGEIGKEVDFGLWGTLPTPPKLATCAIIFLFLLGNTLLVNFTFNSYEFYDKANYLTGFLYLVIALCSPVFTQLNLLVSDFLLLVTVFLLLRINQNVDARKLVFNSSFFLGLGISIYPGLIPIAPIIIFVLFTTRPFVFREHLLFVLGLLLPLLYAFATYYVIHHELYNWISLVPLDINLYLTWSEGTLWFLFAALMLYSYFIVQRKKKRSTVRFKKLAQISVALTLFSFLSDAYAYLLYGHFFFNVAAPLSILLCLGGIYSANSRFFEILFSLVLFCMIWLNLVRVF